MFHPVVSSLHSCGRKAVPSLRGVSISKQTLSVTGTIPLNRKFQSFSLQAVSGLSVLQDFTILIYQPSSGAVMHSSKMFFCYSNSFTSQNNINCGGWSIVTVNWDHKEGEVCLQSKGSTLVCKKMRRYGKSPAWLKRDPPECVQALKDVHGKGKWGWATPGRTWKH